MKKLKPSFSLIAILLLALLLLTQTAILAQSGVTINEIRIDQPGTDYDEYFELAGPAGASLDGLTYLVIGDGASGSGVIENVTDLTGQTIPSSGFFVVAEGSFTLGAANLTTNLNFENSDNVTHLLVDGFRGANGADLDTNDDGVLDLEPWNSIVDSVALIETVGSGDQVYSANTVGPDGSFVPGHAFLCDAGWEIGGFGAGSNDTPGAANNCGPAPEVCGDEFTPIYAIQGSGSASSLDGSVVSTEGVVTGDFQTWMGLRGFFMQDATGDGNAATSDGIFVYDGSSPAVDVAVGDVVRVRGVVDEYYGLTEITSLSLELICGSGGVAATPFTLPVGNLNDFEPFEGMLINIPQTLYATDNYNQGRYGEVTLSVNARQDNPTNVVAPGAAAQALQDLNDRSRIQLDDGRTAENPSPAPYMGSGNTLRAGDTIPELTGVLGYAFGAYEVHPTGAVNFTRVNTRDASPPSVGGTLTVASFNVLNYFTTLDSGPDICGPLENQDCRGANTAAEFTRQRDKIIDAIVTLNAGIVGLMEIENHATDAAMADLVNGLNAIAGAGAYDYISTGPIGVDVIKIGLIYQPAVVTPVGPFAILDSSVDPTFDDDKNRPALAQTFEQNSTGAKFTVVVNHLKSKGSPCEGDPDIGDGQGNCNLTRVAAATAEAAWLATDPTGSRDPDFLIIGDLNAYAMEDPIVAIESAGYTDLLEAYLGLGAYTYVYFGQAGYLDHALANPSLTSQVAGANVWHINADEPNALDYNDYNQPDLYNPDPYRASDHDPVLAGLDLNGSPDCSSASPSVNTLWPPEHQFVPVDVLGVTDPEGDTFVITIDSIFQDEPVNSDDDGNFTPDGQGVGAATAEVRAERDGLGNGRVYHISFTADDGTGTCSGELLVGVPRSQGQGNTPVDDGALFDSTVP